VLEVLDRIGERSRLKIYVRRVTPDGVWHDGFQLESSADDVIEREREGLRKMLEARGKQLDDRSEPPEFEVIRYHYAYRSHDTADVYFNRIEGSA
jgi:hypothetical protein